MVKQKVYLLDTGKSRVGDASVINDYTRVNSGSEMLLHANNVSMQIGKATTVDTSIARKDSIGRYKEGTVQSNSVSNRTYTVSGILDISKNTGTIEAPVYPDQITFANLILASRSPALFALRCEFTDYDDNPNGVTSTLDTNVIANSYVYVVITNFSPLVSADDQNIVDYNLECVFIND